MLDVPAELAATFRYRAGQFCTFRVPVGGEQYLRSYSMSSAPETTERAKDKRHESDAADHHH